MLRFAVYPNDGQAKSVNLAGAHLLGGGDVPVRAEITSDNEIITCDKREAGPASFVLLWNIEGVGCILVETTRLPEREKPYVLQVELARGRLTHINSKIEDWGLLDHPDAREAMENLDLSRKTLILALQADTPVDAARLGQESLCQAVLASEELSRIHSIALLQRRKQSSGFGRRVFGCCVGLGQSDDAYRKRLLSSFDFVNIPVVWRDIEPTEQTFNWKPLDTWVEYLARKRMPMKGSALLSFDELDLPDWLYVWEHDFETIRDLAFEHVKRVMNRYGQYIPVWDVVSGIHAQSSFTLAPGQLIELTRMAASAAKQASSRCMSVINIVAPWGEYYARNQRTIPPMLYADMVLQSGVSFEAFGLQFCFGPARDGMFVRDMFQISSILDLFGKLGKPLYVTATQVPSQPLVAGDDGTDGENSPEAGGWWRQGWSEQAQSEWLGRFLELALSKPFVERVCYGAFSDDDSRKVPHGGLLTPQLTPKPAHETIVKLRADLLGPSNRRSGSKPSR